jgi:hypothetical protein
MMMPIGTANTTQALQRAGITDVTSQCVAGIGRIGDQAASAHNVGRAANEPQLRILMVQLEVLSHGRYHSGPELQPCRSFTP